MQKTPLSFIKNAKNAAFFYKEDKTTQRMQPSFYKESKRTREHCVLFEKNAKERKRTHAQPWV